MSSHKKGRKEMEGKEKTKKSMWNVFTLILPGPDLITALRLLDLSVRWNLIYTPHGFPGSSPSCEDMRGSGLVQANVHQHVYSSPHLKKGRCGTEPLGSSNRPAPASWTRLGSKEAEENRGSCLTKMRRFFHSRPTL